MYSVSSLTTWVIFSKLQTLSAMKRGTHSGFFWRLCSNSIYYISRLCPLNNVHLSSKFLVKIKCWGLAKVEECISLICTWSINSWYILIRIFCYTSHIGWRRLAWMQLVGRVCSCERRRSSQKNISNIYCKLSLVCLWMTSFGKNQTLWGLDEKADKTAMLCLRTTDVFTVLFHLHYQLQIHGSITVLVNRFFCL